MEAWEYYLHNQHILVGQELDEFLQLKDSNDWFTVQYTPSEEECMEFRKIVLNNLLCMYIYLFSFS